MRCPVCRVVVRKTVCVVLLFRFLADVDWWECVDEGIPGLMPEKMMIERGVGIFAYIIMLYRLGERNKVKQLKRIYATVF